MYSRIVCGIDGSELSSKALRHALALGKSTGAEVLAVTVTDPSVILAPGAEMMMIDTGPILADLEKAKAESARTVLEGASKLAIEAGSKVTGIHIANSTPAEGIIHAAKEQNADLIVMGSHGRRGLGRLLLGSQAAEVLAHADMPVLIVK